MRARIIATVAAGLLATVAGCGVGPGEAGPGVATLTVTLDHGAEPVLEATIANPSPSETVVRALDREAEIETSFGGNFVDSIGGVASEVEGGRSRDWFFYVNGYWSELGAGEAAVEPGDRIWWDHRDWTDAYRVSAVVGSWPQPFLGTGAGPGVDGAPVEVVCFEAGESCEQVGSRLSDEGVAATIVAAGESPEKRSDSLRLLVGEWELVRDDPVAATLQQGPAASGVYAMPLQCADGRWALDVLDDHAKRRALLTDAGWIAAVRPEGAPATWVVSATTPEGVAESVTLLDAQTLAEHYAVAVSGGEPIRLPAGADPEEAPPEGDLGASCG